MADVTAQDVALLKAALPAATWRQVEARTGWTRWRFHEVRRATLEDPTKWGGCISYSTPGSPYHLGEDRLRWVDYATPGQRLDGLLDNADHIFTRIYGEIGVLQPLAAANPVIASALNNIIAIATGTRVSIDIMRKEIAKL